MDGGGGRPTSPPPSRPWSTSSRFSSRASDTDISVHSGKLIQNASGTSNWVDSLPGYSDDDDYKDDGSFYLHDGGDGGEVGGKDEMLGCVVWKDNSNSGNSIGQHAQSTSKCLTSTNVARITAPADQTQLRILLYIPQTDTARLTASLLAAIQAGDEALVDSLLKTPDIDVDINNAGISAQPNLVCATTPGHGNHQLLLQLLAYRDHGSDGAQSRGIEYAIWTPLICAIAANQEGIVRQLLRQHKLDINMPNREQRGITPLLTASLAGNTGIVRLLLERSDVDLNKLSDQGLSPFFITLRDFLAAEEASAAEVEYGLVVQLFLARRDLDLNKRYPSPHQNGQIKQTALQVSIEGGKVSLVRWLLDRTDVDPNKEDSVGETPLCAAISSRSEAILRLLLARDDLDVNKVPNDNFPPPLHVAIRHGVTAAVKLLLLRKDLDVNRFDRGNQCTALQVAVDSGDDEILGLLVSHSGRS